MILQHPWLVNELFITQTPELLTAVLFGSNSGSLGFSGSGPALFASFLGSTFFGAMLKAAGERELEGSCEMRQRRMSSSEFYIPIPIQAKTRRTDRTIWDTIMNHTRSGGWSTEWRGSALIALRGEYQHVHTLFSLWGARVNGRGIRVILCDGEMVS